MNSRNQNRATFPLAAAMIDRIREHFPNASVTYARQNEREIGRRDDGFVATQYPYPTHFAAKAPRLGKIR